MNWQEWVAAIVVLSGALLILFSAIGVLRLPDVLCRAHAIAKALTLGIFLMLLGLWIHLDEQQTGMKIVLAMFFQMVTIPIASHLIGLLAYEADIPRWRRQPHPTSSTKADPDTQPGPEDPGDASSSRGRVDLRED